MIGTLPPRVSISFATAIYGPGIFALVSLLVLVETLVLATRDSVPLARGSRQVFRDTLPGSSGECMWQMSFSDRRVLHKALIGTRCRLFDGLSLPLGAILGWWDGDLEMSRPMKERFCVKEEVG